MWPFRKRRSHPPVSGDPLVDLPLSDVEKVTFYKRDEFTSDLICCDVRAVGRTWTFHEEADGWAQLIDHLESLPGFRKDWFAAVSRPPFLTNKTVAFSRR
jgi:hypothetical protein